ncbi:diaminopimelate epimerase [Seinonella peptonophila]|uniref:Diaminopimelate epimerase n=1 Tax=Seinonella peptonophila TaxID=112248 RepID=A0A1M4UXD2_9BACL|nr:diaminopimelate epimerase [Seinonella peptonophila]SHE61300.1 diaminopimelate epimerase [Seinonella peptonophila]
MKFTKMHGLGNDFVVVQWEGEVSAQIHGLAEAVCDRHFGIGADGLVLILPSDKADFKMRIFNADGQESQQCGNAIRCVTKYFLERIRQSTSEVDTCTVETSIGVQQVWPKIRNGLVKEVTVDMGAPILIPAKIPLRSTLSRVINQPITVGQQQFDFTAISMGNPHLVIEVEDVQHFPVDKWGPLLEKHDYYPEKTNVEFITIQNRNELTMRVWERGVGITLACGSGACAALVAAVLLEKADRSAVIHLPKGDLQIEWREENDHVYMTGAAESVFDGVWQQ